MKLEQGQLWKKGDEYYRIVEWSRPSIVYKLIAHPDSAEGQKFSVTKKEFCHLLKGAELLPLRPRIGGYSENEEEEDSLPDD